VLLVKRHDKVAFMAGAFVFPGGRVDEADRQVTANWNLIAAGRSRFADLTPGGEWPYRVAGARELSEEAGVSVKAEDLIPVAHWVTPADEPRRYDTRFFVVQVAGGQGARHDDQETVALEWFAPEEALRRHEQREIRLPPPTWTMIKRLSLLPSLGGAIEWARAVTIVRVQPNLIHVDGRKVLTLPGDPEHPTVPGWEVPEHTRFVLQDDRGWRPAKA
jgi:8-oxo-dGTP pyrophosphatase MutT (NUDIX family)